MKVFLTCAALAISACTSTPPKTVDKIDLQRFMGDWYVLAGRFTMFETDVHNGKETYTWNAEEKRIDIGFTYNKGGFDGPLKSLPQKGWVENKDSNAHWKVSPFWPLKFNYLIVAIADDYSWTAIGVPDQQYLWIMARDWKNSEAVMKATLERLNAIPYDTKNIVTVPHR